MIVTNFSPPALQFILRSKQGNTKEDSIIWITGKYLFSSLLYTTTLLITHIMFSSSSLFFFFFKPLQYWLVKWQQRNSFKKETDSRRKLLIIRRRAVIITDVWVKGVVLPAEAHWFQSDYKKANYLSSLRFSSILSMLTAQSNLPWPRSW